MMTADLVVHVRGGAKGVHVDLFNSFFFYCRILTENPHLLQMYKDLVITQVLTSEEFWATHAKRYTQQQHSQKQEIGK